MISELYLLQLKSIQLADGESLYCMWISRDLEYERARTADLSMSMSNLDPYRNDQVHVCVMCVCACVCACVVCMCVVCACVCMCCLCMCVVCACVVCVCVVCVCVLC